LAAQMQSLTGARRGILSELLFEVGEGFHDIEVRLIADGHADISIHAVQILPEER